MHASAKRPLSNVSGAITIERGLAAALVLLAAFSILSLIGVPLDTLFSSAIDRPAAIVVPGQ